MRRINNTRCHVHGSGGCNNPDRVLRETMVGSDSCHEIVTLAFRLVFHTAPSIFISTLYYSESVIRKTLQGIWSECYED